MVVEDDPDVRTSLVQVLEDEGYAVSAAANGREALALLRTVSIALPHLILLDLMMPVLDGRGFLKERSRDAQLAQIPVLVLTASGNSPDAPGRSDAATTLVPDADTTSFTDGATGQPVPVLRKPFGLDRLLTLVTSMCTPANNPAG